MLHDLDPMLDGVLTSLAVHLQITAIPAHLFLLGLCMFRGQIWTTHLLSVMQAFQVVLPVCKTLPGIICGLYALHVKAGH